MRFTTKYSSALPSKQILLLLIVWFQQLSLKHIFSSNSTRLLERNVHFAGRIILQEINTAPSLQFFFLNRFAISALGMSFPVF